MSLYSVKALLILESESGTRLVGKYYSNEAVFSTKKAQDAFEARMHSKTKSVPLGEILVMDEFTILYKPAGDCLLFVVGSKEENELLLLTALNTFRDSLDMLLKGQVDKRAMLENLDYVLLTIDELVDGGILLETEVDEIFQRVSLKAAQDETPITEQTISQAVDSVKESLIKSFLS